MKNQVTNDNRKAYVYVLVDPRDNQVRYVGKTLNTKNRLREHIKESQGSSKNPKVEWIRSVLMDNQKPLMNVIEVTTYESAKEAELKWMMKYIKDGVLLTNSSILPPLPSIKGKFKDAYEKVYGKINPKDKWKIENLAYEIATRYLLSIIDD